VRLVLPIPAEWPRRELADGRSFIVVAGPTEQPVATLTLIHPHIAEMSLIELGNELTRLDLPSGATSEMQSARVEKTRVGWEMQLVHTVVARPGQPGPLEVRLTAVYNFVPYQTFAAAALARVLEPARFAELRPQLEGLFAAGRPDWNGPQPASLAQLYEG
jgi:hypothetical protein